MQLEFHNRDLSAKLLDQAFPFHLVVSLNGQIASCGEPLRKKIRLSESGTNNFFEHFNIQHPTGIDRAEQLVGQEDKLFLLASKDNANLLLRGQLVAASDEQYFVFLISPWLTNIDVLDTLGFTLQDFPVHSPLSDFLILVQAQRVSLSDSMRLSDELSHLNKELEERMARRTEALELKAKELLASKTILEHEMSERQRVEIELRHSQKMESVGQLAAGIAHEINTPMQYIGSSLSFLKDSFADLRTLKNLIENLLKQDQYSLDPKAIELQQQLETADLAYLCERGPKALDRALDGITRVTEIVGAMNEFTHPDQAGMESADINRALGTVLTVASNEYKYIATIERNYSELPSINCYLGDLNQVFLNLIVNAAHAIAEKQADKGVITISTKHVSDSVIISISDNGAGIPESIQHRIFDPFFTTKEVGKGTGQGLSISHSIIVEKHAGRLTFDTVKGEGTTFHIELPIYARTSKESVTDSDDGRELAA